MNGDIQLNFCLTFNPKYIPNGKTENQIRILLKFILLIRIEAHECRRSQEFEASETAVFSDVVKLAFSFFRF